MIFTVPAERLQANRCGGQKCIVSIECMFANILTKRGLVTRRIRLSQIQPPSRLCVQIEDGAATTEKL